MNVIMNRFLLPEIISLKKNNKLNVIPLWKMLSLGTVGWKNRHVWELKSLLSRSSIHPCLSIKGIKGTKVLGDESQKFQKRHLWLIQFVSVTPSFNPDRFRNAAGFFGSVEKSSVQSILIHFTPSWHQPFQVSLARGVSLRSHRQERIQVEWMSWHQGLVEHIFLQLDSKWCKRI